MECVGISSGRNDVKKGFYRPNLGSKNRHLPKALISSLHIPYFSNSQFDIDFYFEERNLISVILLLLCNVHYYRDKN